MQLSHNSPFAKIPEDQAIEETINKDSKMPGGIIGKSLKPDAVSQWIDTAADRSQITENIRHMAGISHITNVRIHKEAEESRMKIDEKSVSDVIDVIKNMCNPFKPSNDLTSLSTGVTANEDIKRDLFLAHTKGEERAMKFVQERVVSQVVSFFNQFIS